MARYAITPWRRQNDLLEVRQQLYRTDKPSSDQRQYAVDRVMAWKLRGNLPHAVESTALLVDVILHHDSNINSTFSVRAAYSAAFTRFVTGFCDIGRHKDRSLEPSSMLDIAKQIDMPPEFVALRHEATHEELPGIQRLVKATDDALRWLWNVYWSRLEEPESAEAVAASMAGLRAEMRQTLRSFRTARREALRTGSQHVSEHGDGLSRTIQSCLELMGGQEEKMDNFAAVLVEDGLLWPSKREIGSSLNGAYLIWDDLLKSVCVSQRQLSWALVRVMLERLSANVVSLDRMSSEKDAICMWLLHILGDHGWSSVTRRAVRTLRDEVMRWCCLYSGHWTQHLGRELTKSGGPDFSADWRDLFKASKLGASVSDESFREGRSTDKPPALQSRSAALEHRRKDEDKLGSWTRAIRPSSAPIGVVQ